ncbi:hypothetical protein SSCG_02104 [Streptomyces clavuligerus]|nr:hypothetical protein SSCG_02104 [Streptomyces clavuligerus]
MHDHGATGPDTPVCLRLVSEHGDALTEVCRAAEHTRQVAADVLGPTRPAATRPGHSGARCGRTGRAPGLGGRLSTPDGG